MVQKMHRRLTDEERDRLGSAETRRVIERTVSARVSRWSVFLSGQIDSRQLFDELRSEAYYRICRTIGTFDASTDDWLSWAGMVAHFSALQWLYSFRPAGFTGMHDRATGRKEWPKVTSADFDHTGDGASLRDLIAAEDPDAGWLMEHDESFEAILAPLPRPERQILRDYYLTTRAFSDKRCELPSLAVLAKQYGVPFRLLRKRFENAHAILRREPAALPKNPIKYERHAAVKALYATGLTRRQVAEKLGLSFNEVAWSVLQ